LKDEGKPVPKKKEIVLRESIFPQAVEVTAIGNMRELYDTKSSAEKYHHTS
jgi:hypothetical protein